MNNRQAAYPGPVYLFPTLEVLSGELIFITRWILYLRIK